MCVNCYAICDFFLFFSPSHVLFTVIYSSFQEAKTLHAPAVFKISHTARLNEDKKEFFFSLLYYAVGDNKMNLVSTSSPNMLGSWFWNVKESRVLMFSTVSYDRSPCYSLTMVKKVVFVASVAHVSHVPYDVSCRISCNVFTTYPPNRWEWNSSKILL